ncbi:MAG: hypothetical protein QOE90_1380 [Thermoplasmata archaeon]|nr:hypothetical protein [Thermoplasmata archaeon]
MRGLVSRVLFSLGVLLVLAAAALIAWARAKPPQGFEDLGWFVFGLLLLAVAGIPFALSLLAAPRAGRPFVATAELGALLAALASLAFLTTGTPMLMALGALVLVLALAGALRGVGLWRASQA